MTKTLRFYEYDDGDGGLSRERTFKRRRAIRNILREFIRERIAKLGEHDGEFRFWNGVSIDRLADKLYRDGVCTFNRVEKYRAFAFAIGPPFVPFWTYSKDVEPKLIQGDADAPPFPEDHDVHPVVKVLQMVNI